MWVASHTGLAALLLLLQLHSVVWSYVITTPRKWIAGFQAQICVTVSPDTASDQDEVRVTVFTREPPRNPINPWGGPLPPTEQPSGEQKVQVLIPETVLEPQTVEPVTCYHVSVPFTGKEFGRIQLTGSLGGAAINNSKDITFATNVAEIFIQTDKYLYKADQKVQFRVLTLQGPFFKVSTDAYPDIIVETPSGSRIAQWLNVSNPSGLIHLDLQLIQEPDEGEYKIKAKSPWTGETVTKTFKVEEYVLPRFEVTIVPPKYLLADADLLKVEICARYTFGQDVKGNLSVTFSNTYRRGPWSGHDIVDVKNLEGQLFGCKLYGVPLRSLKINGPGDFHKRGDQFAKSISIKTMVQEQGTAITVEKETTIEVSRTVLTMDSLTKSLYKKPELPYVTSVKATFPDGSLGALEPLRVCVASDCLNMTTDDQGIIWFAVPPHINEPYAQVTALNYPTKTKPADHYPREYMHQSRYNAQFPPYFSPSNSSLIIIPDTSTRHCTANQSVSLTVPVMFSASNVSDALLHVQVVSRGQIQYWKSETVSFAAGPLPLDEAIYIVPMQPPASPSTVRGTLKLTVELPYTVSPSVKIVIWYSRPDGEIVSDARELKVDKCLQNSVDLAWGNPRAELGHRVPLVLSAEPTSLCSLGVVDKSVDLLGADQDSLTLDKVFEIAERTFRGPWISQVDDTQYCKKKEYPDEEVPEESTQKVPLTGEDFVEEGKSTPLPAEPEPELDYMYSTDFVDALKMFDESGLYIISDQTYETRPCNRYERYVDILEDFRPMASPSFDRRPGGPELAGTPVADTIPSRTYFPETWLWELATIEESGTSLRELILPDTVTEWVGRAVCVHPSKGVGISPPARVTAFTPFFVDLTVLPTVKKGEVMPIIISVFNYLHESLPVRITLEASPEYEILSDEGQAVAVQEEAGVRTACVRQGDKETVLVRIRPLVVGSVNITVNAVADTSYPEQCGSGANVSKVDRIISPIIVEYEGFPREKSWSKYMCSEDLTNNLDSFEEWRLEAPADNVPESDRAWVTVVGDLLGPTLENIGNLITLPTGCGEQNMIKFAPNIFVLQYLQASDQATEAVADKITSFMKSGYQRELTYKHSDGSYSAFGKRDDSGSTWLTAFVVKSFAQARQFINIDSKELELSTNWLKSKQLATGCFESVGKVLHKEMKGGLGEGSSPAVLSAFVMMALLEAEEDPASQAITNAVACLKSAGHETQSPYYSSLKAYALSLARHPEADLAISDLLAIAVDSPAGLYWESPATATSGLQPHTAVSPVAVETAGYALLAMTHSDSAIYSQQGRRLVKWISEQRNSQGGFISTQDTVVALQALAAYESYQTQELLDLSVTVRGEQLSAEFKLVESNKLLSQRAEVSTLPTTLLLDMAGTGCTLVQAVVRYNIREPEPSEAFSISVTTSQEGPTSLDGPESQEGPKSTEPVIRTCASYLLDDNESNMAVIEVGLVSGYVSDKTSLKRQLRTGKIKRYEVDGSKVLFYLDELSAQVTCVEFNVIKEVEVENAKPGTVKVYDYYEPDRAVSEKYDFQNNAAEILVPGEPILF